MKRMATALPDVCILEPDIHGDHRGFFMETYSQRDFAELGIRHTFVQDNHSRSTQGVLRGLHYQIGQPQAKLVRVIRGEVFDVAVDIRRGSPTFGQWAGTRLSETNRRSMFVPEGFAHGFYVLSDVAEFIYKCSNFYAPAEERGILWNDPDVAIDWPLLNNVPTMSEKDLALGTLRTRRDADLPVYSK